MKEESKQEGIKKVVIDKTKILSEASSGKVEEKKKEFDADKVNAILAWI